MPSNGGVKKALATAALLMGSLAVGLAAAETLVRWHASGSIKEHWQARLRPGTTAGIEFEMAPCPQCTPAINPLGFRGPQPARAKPAGVYRIAVIGDSATFGSEVNEEQNTMPGHLEEVLNQHSLGPRFEVLNAGVPGYNVRQIYYTLVHKVIPLKPDLVVYNFFPNDMDNELYEVRNVGGKDVIVFKLYDGPEGVPLPGVPDRLHAFFNDHFFLYKYVTWAIHGRRLKARGEAPGGITPAQRANLQYLDKMARLCWEHGAGFAVATTAYSRCAAYRRKGDPVNLSYGPIWCENPRRIMDAVLQAARDLEAPAFDMQTAVESLPLEQLAIDPRDHYTPLGNRAMAEALYGFLAGLYGKKDGMKERTP